MSIRPFELFHGAVLTKIVRSDRPTTLSMIETTPTENWSAYKINDEITLVLKHSTTPLRLKRESGSFRWQFTLGPDQIRQLSGEDSWLALICGSGRIGKRQPMEVCLLGPQEINRLVDSTLEQQQPIYVKFLKRKSLRVSSPRAAEFVVPRNRIDRGLSGGDNSLRKEG